LGGDGEGLVGGARALVEREPLRLVDQR
jgi:hypothetical protein